MAAELPLEDLIRLPDFYVPAGSPDGDRVAYYGDETGRIELYVRELDTGTTERISDGDVPRSMPYPIAWGVEGERIYFHENEGGDEQNDLYEMTLDGERTPLVEHDGQCVLEDVGPNGRYLLFTSTAGDQKNLYRYDRETDASERLTDYDRPVWKALFSPDGDRIAYTTNETDDLENRDVYVSDADGTNPRNLELGEVGSESGVVDWVDGQLLVADNAADLGRAGTYDLDADAVVWYGTGDYDERAAKFTPDGDVLALRTRECAVVPVRYADPDDRGAEFDLPEGVGQIAGAGVAGVGSAGAFTADGRVLVVHETADSRKRLYAYDLDADEYDVVVDAEYGDVDPGAFADAEFVSYESHDGLEIGGLLYDSGERPSPGLVKVHGGPHGQSRREFDPFVQYLVSRGYSVFAPNYRGSVGRGQEFKNLIHGDWGGDEQGDVAEAGRWLGGRDWIDDDRVAVYGGSYGGYSTYCQLTMYPDLWTTGIAVVGITDLRALYEESMPHFKSILEEQLGDPEENETLYRERSPITHVEEMERPICVIHGVNDPRCPISQARLFRDALTERDWTEGEDGDFEYHELGEQGHGSADTDQRIRQHELLVDFIERRL